jgi:hypothetical protein
MLWTNGRNQSLFGAEEGQITKASFLEKFSEYLSFATSWRSLYDARGNLMSLHLTLKGTVKTARGRSRKSFNVTALKTRLASSKPLLASTRK